MAKTAKTFKAHYQKLKEIADTMSNQEEPDIDKLIPLVEQATEAYKFCQARIEAVEQALQKVHNDSKESNSD